MLLCLGAAACAQTTYTVNVLTDSSPTTGGSGSGTTGDLRYAITQADTAGGANIIDFSADLSGTIKLTGDLPAIEDNGLTIDGAGASITVSGNNTYRCFFIGAWSRRIYGFSTKPPATSDLDGGNHPAKERHFDDPKLAPLDANLRTLRCGGRQGASPAAPRTQRSCSLDRHPRCGEWSAMKSIRFSCS